MNIIPIVLSFILVLAYSSLTLIKERRATHIEQKSYSGHMAALREARNEQELDHLRGWTTSLAPEKTKKEKQEKQESPQKIAAPTTKEARSQKETEKYEKKRELRRSCSFSHLNLSPLIESPSPLIEKAAAELITSLYGSASFFKEEIKNHPKLSEEIFAFILKTAKEKEETFTLVSPLEEKSPLQKTLYKMLKGTNAYDIQTKKGYPPLEDYFTFNRDDKTASYIHFATTPLLDILFGKEITTAIITQEKEKWLARDGYPYITEDELEALLMKKRSQDNILAAIKPLICFKNTAPKKTTLPIVDPKTHIRLNQPLHEWKNKE